MLVELAPRRHTNTHTVVEIFVAVAIFAVGTHVLKVLQNIMLIVLREFLMLNGYTMMFLALTKSQLPPNQDRYCSTT